MVLWPKIIEELSISENITMSSDTSLRSEAIAILTEFGLEHLLDRNPKKLSGGEKRIISILRHIIRCLLNTNR